MHRVVAQQFWGEANALRKQIVVKHLPDASENFGYEMPFGIHSRSWVKTGISMFYWRMVSRRGVRLTKSFAKRVLFLAWGADWIRAFLLGALGLSSAGSWR